MFKNTLARRAVEGRGLDEITDLFEGPVAIAFVHGDAAAAAKALREFGRSHEALVLKGGLLGERVITPVEIEALADLPSREALLTQIAGAVPAAADPGGRPVPGLPAQPRLRRQGADRPASRRGEAAPVDDAPSTTCPADDAPAADDDAPRATDDAPAAEADASPAEAEAEAPAEPESSESE